MKIILIFVTVFTLVQCVPVPEVVYLSDSEEVEAMRLFKTICAGGNSDGIDGNKYVYCDPSHETRSEKTRSHTITIPPNEDAPKQVIFVQPPSSKFKHTIKIEGSPGKAAQPTVYVLPPKDEHSFEHTYEQEPAVPLKPNVYYFNEKSQIANVPTESRYGSKYSGKK